MIYVLWFQKLSSAWNLILIFKGKGVCINICCFLIVLHFKINIFMLIVRCFQWHQSTSTQAHSRDPSKTYSPAVTCWRFWRTGESRVGEVANASTDKIKYFSCLDILWSLLGELPRSRAWEMVFVWSLMMERMEPSLFTIFTSMFLEAGKCSGLLDNFCETFVLPLT